MPFLQAVSGQDQGALSGMGCKRFTEILQIDMRCRRCKYNTVGRLVTARLVEKPIQRFFVNAGIYVVSPVVIQSVPENHHIDMPTLLEQHMNKRNNVLMFPIHEYWLDIGRMDDFNRAQTDIYTLGL